MIGKKINQLATELAPVSTDLTIIGDPTTGVSKKITLAQLGAIFSGAVSFYTNLAGFPATGDINVIYCAKDTQKLYLWSGSAYVEVFPSQALLDTYQLRSEKGNANGYASLDSQGKVPISQLPSSIMEYKGTWNASTNTPTLANGTGDTGDVYICNVAGTVNFGAGPLTFAVGDYVIYSGSIWQRSSGAVGTVTSVAVSRSGDALAITGSPVTTSGTINIGFAGTGTQYIKGDGTLATFPSIISQAQNLVTEVYNSTGATLTKGTVVYINGGQGNLPTVTKALASGDSTSAQTYGIVQADITNMNNGYVVVAGRLADIDTQAFSVGTQLYLSSTTAGAYTSTKQYAPAHLVYIGIIVRSHPTQGIIEVKIQNGYELDELHNVAAQSPSNGDILQYVSSTSLWTKVAGTTSNIAEGSNLYYTDARSRAALSFTAGSGAYNSTTGVITIPTNTNQLTNGANYITLASLSAGAGISYNNTTGVIASTITQYTDANARAAISETVTGLDYNNTTGVLSLTSGYVIPTTTNETNWNAAYNDKINSAAVTGTTTKTLTLTQQDGGTITASWTDINTDAVTSVFGRTGAVVAASGDYTTAQVTESGNLYFTNARAIASTLTGYTSGAGTITSSDSILSAIQKLNGNIGALTTGVSSVNGLTGAVTLTTSNIAEGTNLYYTEARVNANTNVAANTAARHNAVTLGTANGLSLSTQVLSLGLASTSTTGALSSTDWNTFNNKTSNTGTVTSVGLSSATSGVTIGSTPITTSGTITLAIATASGFQQGLLSSTDWTTFNNKQSALTNPVTGTGTSNYIPKWTSSSSIGNSDLITDASGNLSIAQGNNPTQALNLYRAGSTQTVMAVGNSNTGLNGTYFGVDANGNGIMNTTGAFANIFSTNGSERMRLNASGNLSIGNTNDTYKLDVTGTGRFTSRLIVNNASDDADIAMTIKAPSGSGKYIMFGRDASDFAKFTLSAEGAATFSSSVAVGAGLSVSGYGVLTNSANKFLVDFYNGNSRLYSMGTNTTTKGGYEFHTNSSDGSLDVIALSIASTGAATFSSSVTAATLIFKDAINSNSYGFRGLSGIVTLDAGSVYPTGWNFQYGGGASSALYINGSGNVGIGNTGTNAKLEVTASSGEVFRADAASGAYRIIANQTQVLLNGLVGIGTAYPSEKLHIQDATNGYVGLRLEGSGSYSGSDWTIYSSSISPSTADDFLGFYNNSATDSASAGYKMRIFKSGTVGIGTSTEGFLGKLQVAGSVAITGQYNTVLPSSSFSYFDGSGQVVSASSNASSLYLDTTWNTTGNPDGIYLNVTNTASGASSKLLNLKVDSVSKFSVAKDGTVAIGNSVATGVSVASTHKVSILIGGVQYYLLASNV